VHRAAWMWARLCARNLDAGGAKHSILVWLAVVVAPAMVAFGVHVLLIHTLGWAGAVLAFMWNVAILYATLGFRQFSHHFTAIRDALEASDHQRAQNLLAAWMRIPIDQIPRNDLLKCLMDYSVVAAHRHVFAVLGWYAVLVALGLGPAGAVLYRMSELAARLFHAQAAEDPYSSIYHSIMPEQSTPARALSSAATEQIAQRAWWWVDYLPARLTTLGFAVVGSFEEVLEAWRQHPKSVVSHDGLIQAAMMAALNLPGDLHHAHLRNLVGIVWRSVVLWLMLIALLTLVKLIG
jgi:adenosylcobinamide-phosphate synthase